MYRSENSEKILMCLILKMLNPSLMVKIQNLAAEAFDVLFFLQRLYVGCAYFWKIKTFMCLIVRVLMKKVSVISKCAFLVTYQSKAFSFVRWIYHLNGDWSSFWCLFDIKMWFYILYMLGWQCAYNKIECK